MLPINESGENITIENVFHSLNTRLNSMMTGNLDSDYGYSYKESII